MRKIGFFLAISLFFGCGKEIPLEEFNSDPSLFGDYIASYTAGLVSKNTDIVVVLAFDNTSWRPNEELDKRILTISPAVQGKLVALSLNTIGFIPEQELKQDTEYRLTLNLGQLTDVPKELSEFNFSFKTLKQDFLVNIRDLQSYTKDYQFLNGIISTSDDMDFETAVQLLSARQGDKKLSIKLDKHMSTSREFPFVIDSVKRMVKDDEITIMWDGRPLQIEQHGELKFEIPGKDNFKIIQLEVEDGEEQMLSINFSDPLKTGQNLKGLVQVENTDNLRFKIQGNILKVLFKEPLDGDLLVEIFQGIQSEDGYKMKHNFAERISFSQLKPGVRFSKNGTILPNSSNFKLNFEAVNLSHIDVVVYKIHSNNILQFLQDNELNGKRNLKRVASSIASKKITLKQGTGNSLKRWSNYSVDLSSLIRNEPGAIYRVELGFKQSYSLFSCDTPYEADPNEDDIQRDPYDVRRADDYDYYYYYWYDNYEYLDSENPCEQSFYNRKPIGTNILASSVGVIVKRGEGGSYVFAVNDIETTAPISGAKIELYTYQQQLISSISTNSDGLAECKLDKYAYFAIVKKGNNTTYIKLDEAKSNAISNFDVSGKKLQEGLKGYIYGERGVWRPGDTLFIGFMLNDVENPIGNNHPIKLKLSDPNGKEIVRMTQRYNASNHYKFVVPTEIGYPTGNWELIISVGGAKFYKTIKIETIKPNRLRIKNKLRSEPMSSKHSNAGSLQVNWLHGAVAKNLKVEMTAKFMHKKTTFKKYTNYQFDDPVRNYETEEMSIYSGLLNEQGTVNYAIRPRIENEAPGMLKAVVMTKAFENGGDFSTDVMTTDYSPYSHYVGIKSPEPNKYGLLETGKNNRFEVVSVNEKGIPEQGRDLQVKIYKVDWRWWWDASYDNLSQYTSSYSRSLVKTHQVKTNNVGKASFDFLTSDNDWGRYLVRVYDSKSGHTTGITVLIDWPYWSGKTKNDGSDNATQLVFNTDKESYHVGEKAYISFPSSEGGRALISLENGSKVVQSFWATTTKGETKVEIPVTSDLAPNVYIHISLLQPHRKTVNDAPIRMYGIVPIEVIDKSTVLEPIIQMADVLKPNEKFTVKVSEKSGKPMTYTLAVVDEGLLDLTRFNTPNAWNDFYAKEALGVRTWDMYNDVIGAFGGRIQQIFSIGGDEDLSGAKAKKANRFKPVVMYLGPFTLEKGKTASHTLNMPYYVGSVRTMVVAGDVKSEAYGSTEKATPVRKPLMVLASMPRVVTPTEKITLPITVFAMEKHVKNVDIQLKTNSGIKVVGSTTQSINFPTPDEKMVYFDLEVGAIEGIGKLQVLCSSGSEKAYYEVEFNIENPNPITYEVESNIIEGSASSVISFSTFGIKGSNEAWLEVSSIPAIDLSRRLDYLLKYPHGCLEQTTSAAFPQLYLDDLIDLSSRDKNRTDFNIKEAIRKVSHFQLGNGGFSYWSGLSTADDWSTSYVGHFLLEAEKKGFVLPLNFKSKWVVYQQKAAKDWRFSPNMANDIAQAYRLFTLALAGKPDLSSMNRMRSIIGISSAAKIRLSAAYALAGQKSAAQELFNSSRLSELNKEKFNYFGSSDRNDAMLLETLVLLGSKQQALKIAEKVAENLSSKKWMSTQSTAYSLYAMSLFAQQNGDKGIKLNYTINGKNASIQSGKSIGREKLSIGLGQNNVKLANAGGNTLFARIIYSGRLPVGEERSFTNNLSVNTVYRSKNNSPINVGKLSQGTGFYVDIDITNTSAYGIDNIALSHIVPSGVEIINMRYTDFGTEPESLYDYKDIRDDRSNYYFSLKSGERKKFRIELNASYLGKYYMPGIQAEAMYDYDYRARTQGEWIEIVQ